MSVTASSRVLGISQALMVLILGLGLAFLGARSSPLFMVAIVLAALSLLFFLRRPDLGLLFVLIARASSDALVLMASGDAAASGGLRGLLLNPNTALVLILIGGGMLTILARGLPLMALPGGVLLALIVVTGLFGTIRSERLLHSLDEWIPMLAAPITYALAASTLGHPSRRLWVPKALAVSFVPPAFLGYAQLLTGGGIFKAGFVRIFSTFVHPNPFALYLVIIVAVFLPLAFTRSRMGLLARLIVLASGPLILGTYARFAWAGLLIVMTCVGLLRYRALLFLAIPLLVLVGLIPEVQMRLADPLGGSFADRIRLWTGLYQQWIEAATSGGTMTSSVISIVGGLGPGASTLLIERVRGGTIPPHNDFIRILVDYGALGLLLYVALLVVVIRLAYQTHRIVSDSSSKAIALGFLALAVAYPVMSLTSNLVAATHNQVYFWTLAGLCVALKRAEDQSALRVERTGQIGDSRPVPYVDGAG